MKSKQKHFKSASIKLTAFYVLIIMTISTSFSLALYRIYAGEIDRGLGRQVRVLRDFQINNFSAPEGGPAVINLDDLRSQLADESNKKLSEDLVYFNLFILIVSSIISYFFARKTLEPIEKSVEEQNRFTADASHELRTPLAAIRSEIEVTLRDKKLSLDQAKGILKSNLEEIGKLEALSTALLQLSRNDEQINFDLEKVNLEEIIIEAYEKVANLSEKKEIVFENDFQSFEIMGQRESLVEILVILLDNAIKYSPKKSKIEIKTCHKDGQAVLILKDHGAGIKLSDLPYIFNRFYRADHSRSKDKVGGYGLGLSIAKQLIDLNKGNITVNSAPGKGTAFTLSFKLANQPKKGIIPLPRW